MKQHRRKKSVAMVRCALFSALIVLSSYIAIPFSPPITLQLFAVALATYMLGYLGALSVLIYVTLGLMGLPVFSGFSGGFGHLFTASGGYIIGFIAFALCQSTLCRLFGGGRWRRMLFSIPSLLVLYLFGSVWYTVLYLPLTLSAFCTALLTTVLPFIIPDVLKLALAMLVASRLEKIKF